MAAALNPRQFFHGTTYDVGDKVLPAKKAGSKVSDASMGDPGDQSQGDHAFVTEDENYAWAAAGMHHRNGDRPRVYETDKARGMKPGPWNKEHPDYKYHHGLIGDLSPETTVRLNRHHQPEWASKTGFPVRGRIDVMPGHQGTFPGVNWNDHKADGKHSEGLFETNHPEDNQVRYGMHWNNGGSLDQAYEENKRVDLERNPPSRRAAFEATMNNEKPKPDPHRGQGKLF